MGLWIAPIKSIGGIHNHDNEIRIKLLYQDCGLITDIRMRTGRKIKDRKTENEFAIVEFAHENSLLRAMKAMKEKRLCFGNGLVKSKVYRAGTRTVVFMPNQKRR